jgi:hypothetical protein
MTGEFRITFPGSSAAERSRLASQMADALAQIDGVQTSVLREQPDTQDPGTILSVILGAPAVLLAVRAVATWLVRNNQSGVTIELPNGTVIAQNMKSEDVPKVVEALKSIVEHRPT